MTAHITPLTSHSVSAGMNPDETFSEIIIALGNAADVARRAGRADVVRHCLKAATRAAGLRRSWHESPERAA